MLHSNKNCEQVREDKRGEHKAMGDLEHLKNTFSSFKCTKRNRDLTLYSSSNNQLPCNHKVRGANLRHKLNKKKESVEPSAAMPQPPKPTTLRLHTSGKTKVKATAIVQRFH